MFSYDSLHRLTRIDYANGASISYTYDAAGNRLTLESQATVTPAEDFTYTTANGEVTITGYTGPGGAVVIPATIDGLPVTCIGFSAFYGCTSITSVMIPASVTNVEDWAFWECPRLTAISVDVLNAFYSSQEGVLFNKSQTLLLQCPGGKAGSYIIPTSVISIGGQAFRDCTSLAGVTIPNSVVSIGENAFLNCTSLTGVTIPRNVTSIGRLAFSNCFRLTSITVDALNSIFCSVDGVLFNKSQTTLITYPGGKSGSYVIPNSVTSIGEGAFLECNDLSYVTIPASVTSIGDWAFNRCTSLTSIVIPPGVTSIGNAAFYECSSLITVAIPDSVTSIGDWAFADCDSLTSIVIPPGVTSIGNYAFYGCSSLTTVAIPDRVASIGQWAFAYCSGLVNFYCLGDAPTPGDDVFIGTNNVTVYYLTGTAGWGPTYSDRPTLLWSPPPPVIEWYVSPDGDDANTGQSWDDAMQTIQAAVDAASPGDTVWVADGTYDTGGMAGYPAGGTLTNRVAIHKAITVRSMNGPEATIIRGAGSTREGAVRCVYVGEDAVLDGFTITGGSTLASDWPDNSGGGVWCEPSGMLVNCILTGNSAHQGGGAYGGGTLNNCPLTDNSATSGGGASYMTLNNCILAGNSSTNEGGGASYCTLNDCTLTGNTSSRTGGGATRATLNSCTLSGNSSGDGGGASWGTLNNCLLFGNRAEYEGGGASYSTLNNCTLRKNSADNGGGASSSMLNNCLLVGNSASGSGGGGAWVTLNNCTVTGNSSDWSGGGVGQSGNKLNNCIVYHNTAASHPNYYNAELAYCCTTPDPGGTGNITDDPRLDFGGRLTFESPCIGAGSDAYASGTDIDGEPWSSPPSMGCDEFSTVATGELHVDIIAGATRVAVGRELRFGANIRGYASSVAWSFGDGLGAADQLDVSHAWSAPGEYTVALVAYNDSNPDGVSSTLTVQIVEPLIHHVDADNPTPMFPYLTWADAATNIQDAIDAADLVGATVLVADGVYGTGGKVTPGGSLLNRIVIPSDVTVQSVNGAEHTTIVGQADPNSPDGRGPAAVRCAYVADGATLAGFTLTNGHTDTSFSAGLDNCGGGAYCPSTNAILKNCVIVGNYADYGGGVVWGTTIDCVLTDNHAVFNGGGMGGGASMNSLITGNSAGEEGGGVAYCEAVNCTIVDNYATYGGGSSSSSLKNCIVYYNTALYGANDFYSEIVNCCTTSDGREAGNIVDADPLFVDRAAGNFRLRAASPCIDAGTNVDAPTTDLDGNLRDAHPDIGAYEYPVATHGDVAVNLDPPEAVSAGAQWRVAEGMWRDSGTASEPLPPGEYTLYFREIPGWHISASATVEIIASDTTTFAGQYLPKLPQTIAFEPLPEKTYGDAPFAISATATSGLTVNWASDNEAVATVAAARGDWMVTIHGAGTATITATQPGTGEWYAAEPIAHTLTVAPATLTATADDKVRLYGDPNPALTLVIDGYVLGEDASVLDVVPAAVCTADATSPTGDYAIVPSGGAAANYAFEYVNGSLTVLAGGRFKLLATADSGGPVALEFGQAEGAATGEDEWDAPAQPGQAARLVCPFPSVAEPRLLARDFRPLAALTRWRLEVGELGTRDERPATRGTVVLTWDAKAAADGREVWLQELDAFERPFGLPVDMKAQNELPGVVPGTVFEIVYGMPETFEIELRRGWNAVGTPVLTTQRLEEWLPTRDAGAAAVGWRWQANRLAQVTASEPFLAETGHLIHCRAESATIVVTGLRPDGTIVLSLGWNLVSPVATGRLAEEIRGRLSAWWVDGLNGVCLKVDIGLPLEPGVAYWLHLDGAEPLRLEDF